MQYPLIEEYFWSSVLAVIASAAGVAAIGLSFFRSERRDIALVTFGATSLLYGLRLLASTHLQQYISTAPPQTLVYFTALCTYIIPIPLFAFLRHLFGNGWKNSTDWALRGAIIFAIAAIASDIILATPGSAMTVNNALVVIWACLVLVNTFFVGQRISKELRIVFIGFLIFGLLAVNENLVQLNLVPWRWAWEELGFVAFLGSLGFVAATRFFANEAQLHSLGREMEIARQIQSSILPRTLPAIPGLDITARYVPMTSVAGDFYDVLLQDKHHVCILVADVSGHGVGAALIASMLKVAFASQQHVLSDPSAVLAGLNCMLTDKLEGSFVTACCLFLDSEKGSLRYAGAGHPPMILHRRTEHKLYELGSNGLLLGPFPEAAYETTAMTVVPGDRLILYTDGIIEATNASGQLFGDGAFKAFIETHRNLAAEEFTDTLLRHLTQWSGKATGESLDDDLTLVVIDKS